MLAKENDVMDEMEEVRRYMKDIIEYNALLERYPIHADTITQMLELMVEAIASPAKTIRIGGQDMPQVVVRSRFEKYSMSIFEYVLDTLMKNTSKVRNIRSYLLTTLYNAPLTIDSYYRAEVNYDMYGSDCF